MYVFSFFLKNIKLFFFFLFAFLFIYSDYSYCKDILDEFTSNKVYYLSYENYDRHFYYNLKYFRFNYFNFYAINFNNLYFNLVYDTISTKHLYSFYTYKYIYFVEDLYTDWKLKNLSFDNYVYFISGGKYSNFSLLQNKFPLVEKSYAYGINFLFLGEYYYSYLSKNNFVLDNNNYLKFRSFYLENIFGSNLFFYDFYFKNNLYSLMCYFLFYTAIFFSLLLFFLYFFFLIFFNFYTYYKFYFIGKFLKILVLWDDEGDDYYGRVKGYVNLLADEDRLTFNQMYYNILKYEFNYLNFLVYSNSYIFFWINTFYNNYSTYFFGLGQLRLSKFNYFSFLGSKIESSFFSGLVEEHGDPIEWRFFPYEHVVFAFPESDFYITDAIYQYADTDVAFDFTVKSHFKREMVLHPYGFGNVYDPQSENEYDDSFGKINAFLKNYKNSDEILTTYSRRFKLLYKKHSSAYSFIEKQVSFSKVKDSYFELVSKNFDLDFDFFFTEDVGFPDTYSYRTEFDRFNFENVDKLFNLDTDENASLYLDRYKIRLMTEDSFLVKNANLHLEDRADSLVKDFLKKSYVTEFSRYAKISNRLLVGNFSTNNFFSYMVNNPFFQWIIRSKFVWSGLSSASSDDGAFDFEPSGSVISSFVMDKLLSKKYQEAFSALNFTESFFFDRNSYIYSQSLFRHSSDSLDSSLFFYCPPFVSFFGYKAMNPYVRFNRDLRLFEILGSNSKNLLSWLCLGNYSSLNLKYNLVSNSNTFNLLKYNSYFVGYSGYPVSLTISTNFSEFDLHKNANLDENRFLEVQNSEDLDNVFSKEEIFSIFKSFSFLSFTLITTISYGILVFSNIF